MQRAAPGDLEGLIFDEDSDDNINLAKLAGADDAGDAAAADGASGNLNEKADEPKLLKRNKRQRPRFTETDLLGSMGLEWIQRNIPRMLAGSIKGKRGSEAKDLQRIMDAYTIWARKIHPNMHSDDVLDRSLVLSSRLSVKNTMDMMREAEESLNQDDLFDLASGSASAPQSPEQPAVNRQSSTAADLSTPPPAVAQHSTGSAGAAATSTLPSAATQPTQVDDDIQAAMAAEIAATQLDVLADQFDDEEAIAAEMDMGGWGDDF